jgi:beta-glucosidase
MTSSHSFLFGAASSAHQAEGGTHNDWTEWERTHAPIAAKKARSKEWPPHILKSRPSPFESENYISGVSADHYNRFEEDFDIAASLGHTAHRFSIEWSRIEPAENEFDDRAIAHYRSVVAALRARNLEPFVTLWHWPIPIWLRDAGGWESRRAPEYFARYTERIVRALGEDVKFWITLNEPLVYASNAYLLGIWPPQRKNLWRYYRVRRNLIRAHRRAYHTIKKLHPEAQVGISKHNVLFETPRAAIVARIAKWAADWWWNTSFLNAISDTQDFIGLNYYFRKRISGRAPHNVPRSDTGWELYPQGLEALIAQLKPYNVPIYITENGLADGQDVHREWFITESLHAVKRALDDGADVRGYLYWSLTDNFEWSKGFWPRFGLVAIDYTTYKRTVRPSAHAYARLIARWPNL